MKPARALLVIAVAAAGLVLWAGLSVGDPVELEIRSGFDPPGGTLDLLGPANRLTVVAREPARGVGSLRVELQQGERSWTLSESDTAHRSPWKPWATPPSPERSVEAAVSRDAQPDLQEGPARVRAVAGRASGFLRGPEPTAVERAFTVRFTPPELGVQSAHHYVAQGGCEVVLYQVGETAARSGVQAGDWFFPGHPLPGGEPGERFALFAVPYRVDGPDAVRLQAEDAVGNLIERAFLDRFFPRPPGGDRISLSDRFLEGVVPEIVARTPELRARGSLLEQYLGINRDLRARNRAELKELAARSTAGFLWRGPFLPLRGAAATSGFAERRTYVYEGREVDRQYHLGFDLASTARAPVEAANDGVVLRAGWFGIYGDAVILDHGYGLLSLYGHLSEVSVAEGDRVERGQPIGRTGMTGLAGGDHLHFAVLLGGLPVNPREWWDDHWIQDRLRLKLGAALPG